MAIQIIILTKILRILQIRSTSIRCKNIRGCLTETAFFIEWESIIFECLKMTRLRDHSNPSIVTMILGRQNVMKKRMITAITTQIVTVILISFLLRSLLILPLS